jgi:AraC-like DNA-binding protein
MSVEQLTPDQDLALGALLSEPTIKQAAAVVGVSERQLHRWLKDDAFSEAYRAARRAAVQQATARLQQASTKAVGVLVGLMDDTAIPAPVRLSAASKVLEMAVKAVELDDLDARLKALEAIYATQS